MMKGLPFSRPSSKFSPPLPFSHPHILSPATFILSLPILVRRPSSVVSAMPTPAPVSLRSTPEERTAVSLTVYNGRFALVREVRPFTLTPGRATVAFEGVPELIEPTSLNLVVPDTPDAFTVREQNYQYDLVGTQTVLDRAVGQRVRLTRHLDGGQIETVDGTLISQPGQGRIVQLDDGRVLVEPEGTIELAALPPGLVSRPTLLWALDVAREGRYDAEASYLTGGLSWKADYVAVLRADDHTLDLTGWVTLDNQSGATFEDATLQLMAGEVRRVQPPMQAQAPASRAKFAEGAIMQPAPFAEETFFEYHLYTLDGTTTLNNRETKQMTLLQAAGATVRRRLVFDGAGAYYPWWASRPRRPGAGGATDEQAAAVVVELTNSEENNMGMPLPAGVVRVYQADSRGNLQFVGEDRIGHTPREEEVRLYIGDAFDVVGTRRVTGQRRISDRETEQTVEVEIRNRKESGVADVAVVERLGGFWRMVTESHEHTSLDAQTIEYPLTVAAGETVTVRYTVRTRY